MNRILAAAAAAAALALPALADSTTVEFKADDGSTVIVTFSDDGTALMDGQSMPYTVDEASKTICVTAGGEEVCATFAEMKTGVGESTTYTSSTGESGTATITAVSED